MKNFLLGVVTTLVLVAVASLGYLLLGFAEVRTDLPPARWESALMHRAVRASVRREAPEIPDPFPTTDTSLIEGGKAYLGDCAGCHGTPGKPEENAAALFPPAPHFPTRGTAFTEAQVFWIAKHGVRRTGMFANGFFEPDEKLWKIAAYIKRMNSLPPAVIAALEEKK